MNLQPKSEPDRDESRITYISHWETIQGEGPFAGERAVFIRLAGCNLQCPFCDTDYTSLPITTIPFQLAEEVLSDYPSHKLIVITGGEPFRQAGLTELIKALLAGYRNVQIETNGTCYIPSFAFASSNVTIVCSPKTAKLHPSVERMIKPFSFQVDLKYIVAADQMNERGLPSHTMGLMGKVWLPPLPNSGVRIYLQPLDEDDPVRNRRNMKAAAEACMKHGHRLSLQLQKIVGLD